MRATLGGVPTFMNHVPEEMRTGLWNSWKSLEMSKNTAVPSKYLILTSLAVSAQTPCQFCVYADRKAAQQAGATEEEINEALAMASTTRFFSTVLNGSQVNFNQFKDETRRIISFTKQHQRGVGGAGKTQ
ncbi:MAG: carboxymuconolactone decarboxylase family protein [Myxococcaceae bacterium]|nr:carboxymuconolactone decarboxylase family protein [Myxococcaceae bacterium]